MFLLLKYMLFMEALCKDRYAGLFGDSSALREPSKSDYLRYSSHSYSVNRPSRPMERNSMKLSDISAM